jgi:hypothetical protein
VNGCGLGGELFERTLKPLQARDRRAQTRVAVSGVWCVPIWLPVQFRQEVDHARHQVRQTIRRLV